MIISFFIIINLKDGDNFNHRSEVQAAGFVFGNSEDLSYIDQEDYERYDEFHITTANGFVEFIATANGGAFLSSGYGGTFENKIVYLDADIVLTADHGDYIKNWNSNYSSLILFRGTFDGQGHSITYEYSTEYHSYMSDYDAISVFCVKNEGTIKNLKLINPVLYAYWGQNAGMIAGINKGTIESCIVEDCAYEVTYYCDSNCIAPICGTNNGTVKNCIVTGNMKLGYYRDKGEINASYFVGSGNEANYCIYNMTEIKSGNNINGPTGSLGDNNVVGSNSLLFDKLKNVYSRKAGYDDGTNAYYIFERWSHGGINGLYLRAFIPWTEYTIKIEDGGCVKHGESVILEKEYKMYNPTAHQTVTIDETNEALIFYNDQKLEPIADVNYVFDCWVVDGNTYTAKFKHKPVELVFKSCSNSNITSESTYYVVHNTLITIGKYAYTGNSDCYYNIVFTFYDSDGDYQRVSYEITVEYYLTCDLESFNATEDIMEIEVLSHLKQYNITFS